MIETVLFDGIPQVEGGVCAAKGFRAAGCCCGLRHEGAAIGASTKNDLGIIVADCECSAAAVYTTNAVKGAPLVVTRKHLSNGKARAVIVNSVNANCCNSDGEQKAEKMCSLLANELSISENDIIVASTGVIGQTLPIEPIEAAISPLCEKLAYDGNESVCEAIMTTDTFKKQLAFTFTAGGKTCTIGGMMKGSGMIHPNMATTLTFITTDCAISQELLQTAVSDVVNLTLNHVSVDGDTSTNDMVCVLASGLAENKLIDCDGEDYDAFSNALCCLLINFARLMARDGEGATKLIECHCLNANSEQEALTAAKSVITSSLFKTMMFGGDANWGRVLCALGYSGIELDTSKVCVEFASSAGKIKVCENGTGIPFSEELAKKILSEEEVIVLITLGTGSFSAVAWGCDLTYEYVKINGDYRS